MVIVVCQRIPDSCTEKTDPEKNYDRDRLTDRKTDRNTQSHIKHRYKHTHMHTVRVWKTIHMQ